jgi:hypothetical protein
MLLKAIELFFLLMLDTAYTVELMHLYSFFSVAEEAPVFVGHVLCVIIGFSIAGANYWFYTSRYKLLVVFIAFVLLAVVFSIINSFYPYGMCSGYTSRP